MTTTKDVKPIILYDIPGNTPECKAWSPNTWKVRYALNYKCIPLKTEWVEYPDIVTLYQTFSLAATASGPDGSPLYTLPVIHDPNTNRTISESLVIAKYLDKTYPDTPVLFPKGTGAFHAAFMDMNKLLLTPLSHLVYYAVWTRLNERSRAHYRAAREARFGKKLEEVRTEEDWKEAEHACGMVDKCLRANLEDGEGRDDLVMGNTICFADIVLASGFMWAKAALGRESEEWARIMSWNEGKWRRIMEKFAKYEVVDV